MDALLAALDTMNETVDLVLIDCQTERVIATYEIGDVVVDQATGTVQIRTSPYLKRSAP